MSQVRKPSERPRRRIGALACLPVFVSLDDRRAIVAGGSAAAAWKAELLAAAGADVVVFTENLSAEMRDLLQQGAAAGSLTHIARTWTPADFDGAAIAVCDAASEAEATAFAAAGRAAGVLTNTIDDIPNSGFQFGAIVNRSPVTIGISTAGAAPVLAQAIRRRIETALPHALADWARLARRVREQTMARLPTAGQRRAFWERFSERVLSGAPAPASGDALDAEIAEAAGAARGRVTLVGAGPGDAEYLTVKAVRALQSADVVLFDDLVADEVLELARREARCLTVGKRGGRQSCRQEDINAMMVTLARQGKHVVRLKSGDPMVFGRGGEEIAQLEAQGIPVEIVPGITAALALAARLGVSLTHRDAAHSVRLVTGHSKRGGLPQDLDWKGLADLQTTDIFYMAGGTAGALAQRLIDEGLPPATPAAIVGGLGRPDERRWAGTLAGIEMGIAEIGREAPVLIGVGQVFCSLLTVRNLQGMNEPFRDEMPANSRAG